MSAVAPSDPLAFEASHPRLPRDVVAVAGIFAAMAALENAGEFIRSFHHVYWQDWSDQWRYVESARAFASGSLDPSQHWYPLLYPLALSLFGWLPIYAAAAAVDLICYVLAYVSFREIAARFGVNPLLALGLFVASTLVGPALAMAWIVPWTTTLSSALIWLALARVCRLWSADAPPPSTPQLAALGALLGLIPLCRPADLVVSGILGLFVLARSRDRIAVLAAGGLAPIVAYGLLHLAIFGPQASDYMKLSAAFGFDFTHIGWKAQTILIDAGPFFPQSDGVIERIPWLPIGAAGLIAAALRPDRRLLALLLGVPAVVYLVLMLAYADLVASNLWAFRLIHYFKWLTPLLALFAFDFVRAIPNRKALSCFAAAIVLAATSLHYDAVTALPGEPAKLLVFADPQSDGGPLMNARTIVTDRAGRLRNLLDYHQAQVGGGRVHMEAWRRDFAGDEVWTDSPADVAWPLMQANSPNSPALLGDRSFRPLARYRVQWRIGAPCWIARSLCADATP